MAQNFLARHACGVFCWLTLVSFIGCTSTSATWRDRLGMQATEPLPPNSLAARVAQIERVAESAESLDANRKAQVTRRLADEVAAESSPLAVKLAAVDALVKIGTPGSLTGLETAMRSPEPELRVLAARGLGQINDPHAVELLNDLLAYDNVADVRLAAAKSLASFRTPNATGVLASVLGDRDPAVQLQAMRSLERVTGKQIGTDVAKWKEYVATLPSNGGSLDGTDDGLRR